MSTLVLAIPHDIDDVSFVIAGDYPGIRTGSLFHSQGSHLRKTST